MPKKETELTIKKLVSLPIYKRHPDKFLLRFRNNLLDLGGIPTHPICKSTCEKYIIYSFKFPSSDIDTIKELIESEMWGEIISENDI